MEQEITLTEKSAEQNFLNEEAPRLIHEAGLDKSQIGYLFLALKKKYSFERLQAKELEMQSILIKLRDNEKATITELTNGLSLYKRLYLSMVEGDRKPLTKLYDDKLYAPAMAFEKRADPKTNEEFIELNDRLFSLREEQEENARLVEAIRLEKSKYANHIMIQNLQIQKDYSIKSSKYINDVYTELLKNLAESPNLEVIKNAVLKIPILEPVKFGAFTYMTVSDAQDIIEKMKNDGKIVDRALVVKKLQDSVLEEIDKKFQMYPVDLAHAKENIKSVEQVQKYFEEKVDKAEEIYNTNISIEKTYATAIAEPISELEGKPIKISVKVEDENTWEWVIRVIDAFRRLPDSKRYIRDRDDWGNLDVHAMAAAIGKYATETGDVISTLKYEEKKI
jgi:hypothetical protein